MFADVGACKGVLGQGVDDADGAVAEVAGRGAVWLWLGGGGGRWS